MRLIAVPLVLALAMGVLLVPEAGRELDRHLVTTVHGWTESHAELDAFMELGTDLGRKVPILIGLFLPAAFGTEFARGTVKLAALGLVSDQIATDGLKTLFNRQRPDGADDRRSNSSFPSGHASAAIGLAWIVAHRHRRWAPWIWTIAVWISVSRVFLERHYVADILGGALVGIAFAALVLAFEERIAGWGWKPGR